MHTHYGSATHLTSTFLGVLIVGGFWRLAWMHGLTARSPLIRGLARSALFQY